MYDRVFLSNCVFTRICFVSVAIALGEYLFFAAVAKAQTIPTPPLPPQLEPAEPQTLPPLEDILPELEKTPSPSQPSPAIPEKLFIQKIVVVGSTVFTPDEIAQVIEPYTSRRLSFVELLEAQTAITQLYLDNGYITSGAFIPAQRFQDGVVTIKVIEGAVEDINITGLERLNPGYIRSRLAVATQAPVNREKLLNTLQMLQLDPLIATISAELAAGAKSGTSILNVRVKEADPFDLMFSLDNYRTPSVGTDRRQVQLTHRNLLGFGDRLNASYLNTLGSDSLNNLSYTIPLNPDNGTLGFRYSLTDSRIIEEPFDVAEIESKTSTYEVSFRQPLYQTPTQDVAVGVAFTRQGSQTTLQDQPLGISRGANEEGETNISAIRLFKEYTTRNAQQVFALRSQFSLGVNVFDATINDDLPDSKFLAWRGQAQYLQLLTPDITLLLRGDLQLADDALVQIEQFSLGGGLSVRGYRQDALLGDNGLFTSAEIRATVLRIPQWSTSFELTPFIDFGKVWNTDDFMIETNTLVSFGVGLRLLVSDRVATRLDWGIPLVDLNTDRDTLQENGVYFSLELQPF